MECEVANRMLGILHSLCLSFMICKKERFKWSIQWLLIDVFHFVYIYRVRTNKERERERNIEKARKKARNNKKEKQISKDQFNAFY